MNIGKVKLLFFLAAFLLVLFLFGCDRRKEAVTLPTAVATKDSGPPPTDLTAPAAPADLVRTVEENGIVQTNTEGNRPPQVIAVPFSEPRIHRGVDIEVLPEGVDPDGDLVTFRFDWFINGEKLSDFNESVLPGDRFRKGDRIALRIIPADGKTEGVPFAGQPFTVPNAPPQFVSTPPLQFQAHDYLYEARAEDPDEEELTYLLAAGPEGMTVDAASGRVSWSIGKAHAGDHQVRLVVQDTEGLKAVQEYTLTISIEEQEGE